MSAMSDYLGELFAEKMLNNGPNLPSLVTLYFAYTDVLQDEANVASGDEPSGLGYARLATASNFEFVTSYAAAGGVATNINDMVFATSSGSQGTILSWSCYDAITIGAGNLLWFGALSASRVISLNDALVFPAGSLGLDFKV